MKTINRKFPTFTSLYSHGNVLIFYALACGISWFFLLNRSAVVQILTRYEISERFAYLGVMWGPGIAAIICFAIFRKSHNRTITFKGTSFSKGLLFYFLPFVIFAIMMVANPISEMELSKLFFLIPFGFLMILGEELGWRGYLQDALRHVPEWRKWVLIAILWEVWHFDRGWMGESLVRDLIIKLVLFVATFILTLIIGKLTEKTKSLLVAIALHSWINMLWEIPHLNTFLTFGVSIFIWYLLLRSWPSTKITTNKQKSKNPPL